MGVLGKSFSSWDSRGLHISLVCEEDRALDLFINRNFDGSATCAVSAYAKDNPGAMDRIRGLASLRNYDETSPTVMNSCSFDREHVNLSIMGEGSVMKAISVVTNPYLGEIAYSAFGHDKYGLYGYWDNENLTALHSKISKFLPGPEGDYSREYLRNADRFWVYRGLDSVFRNKTARDTARAFDHKEVDRLATLVGSARRAVVETVASISIPKLGRKDNKLTLDL